MAKEKKSIKIGDFYIRPHQKMDLHQIQTLVNQLQQKATLVVQSISQNWTASYFAGNTYYVTINLPNNHKWYIATYLKNGTDVSETGFDNVKFNLIRNQETGQWIESQEMESLIIQTLTMALNAI